VVNLDLLSKNAAEFLPVSSVVDTVIVRLGRLFVAKLVSSGHTTAATLLALERADTPSQEEADQYLTHLDCPLLNQVRTQVALGALQSSYEAFESKLLQLLALRARRELNQISDDPPLATRLAHELEALLVASPLHSRHTTELIRKQAADLSDLTNLCRSLLDRPALDWSTLVKASSPVPVEETLLWAGQLAHAVSQAGSLMHRNDGAFAKELNDEGDLNRLPTYRQLLKHKHRQLEQQWVPTHTPSKNGMQRWEDVSAQLMSERNFHAFAVCVDDVISQLKQKLSVWSRNEIARSSIQKTRLLDVENFHYADGIRRGLHQCGESLEDALVCAEKLLQYCHENQVPAAELMDDEIWTLFPRINRENLKRSRLAVRHSDALFPLSVVHREWITQVTEKALAPKT
jgi:hypothetical protein